jgi:hypothetical protein
MAVVVSSSVYPSGGDFATNSAPSAPPAPARLSTTTCWPRLLESFCARRRPSWSGAPPAESATISLIGRFG